MLKIKNLNVSVGKKEIIKDLNLEVSKGEIHAIMGPNGAGKSTLVSFLAGKKGYKSMKGEVVFKDKNILELLPEERAREGLFIGFQYPVEIPGVSSLNFLKMALNEIREYKGLEPLDAIDFMDYVEKKKNILDLHEDFLHRSVNEGFSGGEKKRFEIFQMALLEPDLAILDETDSGLDIDALKDVADGVNKLRSKNNSVVLITHYQRLLKYIVPDKVHIFYDGKIIKSGDKSLASYLEETGYQNIL